MNQHRNPHRNPAQQQALVQEWNAAHAIGTKVTITLDGGAKKDTATRSDAWLMGGHTAVVQVEGIAGGYALHRIKAIAK